VNNKLKRLKLLDRKVTKTGKSRGFDLKHIFKRWRKMARSARREPSPAPRHGGPIADQGGLGGHRYRRRRG
jgi:hypothetical protein